jgi:aryl carrier-like protein
VRENLSQSQDRASSPTRADREPLNLESFVESLTNDHVLGREFWVDGDDDNLLKPIDSIATLELLVWLDDQGWRVDFGDFEMLAGISDLRSFYLAYLAWNQMP